MYIFCSRSSKPFSQKPLNSMNQQLEAGCKALTYFETDSGNLQYLQKRNFWDWSLWLLLHFAVCCWKSLSICVSKGLHIHDLWSCMCVSTLFSLQPVISLCNVIQDCTSDNRILLLGCSTYLWKCHISANNDASQLQQAWNFRELLVICRQSVLRLHVREI